MRYVLVFLLGALVGCVERLPSAKKARWHHVQSEHFDVLTDRREAQAVALARELERLLAAYLELGWQIEEGVNAKLRVIAFDDGDDFDHFFGGEDRVGLFIPSIAFFEPTMIVGRSDYFEDWLVLKHELAHHIAHQALGRQPTWLAEGLASYFESARFDEDSGEFVVGEAAEHRLLTLQAFGRLAVPALLTWSERPTDQFYASAWLLVHYLMSEQGDRFARYQRALAEGASDAQAWTAGFPDLTTAQLDANIDRYAKDGRLMRFSRAGRPVAANVKVERLERADVHALFSTLYRICQRCDADERNRRSIAEADAALALDPSNASAIFTRRIAVKAPPDVAAARATAYANPGEWLAWLWVLWEELRVRRFAAAHGEIDAATKLIELAPTRPFALGFAAITQALRGNVDSARQLSARGVRLAPSDPSLRLLRLTVLTIIGDCRAAAEAAHALAQMPHRPWSNDEIARIAECPARLEGVTVPLL